MSGLSIKPRVLVVDDKRIVADTLSLIFSKAGYECRAFYSAELALGIVHEWIPHLALLDVHLPTSNGIELALQLKRRCPGCIALLLSGAASAGDLLDAARRDGHVFDIVAKPVHPQELLDLAARLIPVQCREPFAH